MLGHFLLFINELIVGDDRLLLEHALELHNLRLIRIASALILGRRDHQRLLVLAILRSLIAVIGLDQQLRTLDYVIVVVGWRHQVRASFVLCLSFDLIERQVFGLISQPTTVDHCAAELGDDWILLLRALS